MSAALRLALAVPAALAGLLRPASVPARSPMPPPAVEEAAPPAPSRGVRTARLVLIALGVLLIGVAGGLLTAQVRPQQWPGIVLWLAGAIVLHDGVFAPLVWVGSRALRRVGARFSWAAVAVVQVALVVGGAITFVAFPGIRAQQLGARNPTVLVFDYGLGLSIAWLVLGVLTATIVIALSLRTRLRRHEVVLP